MRPSPLSRASKISSQDEKGDSERNADQFKRDDSEHWNNADACHPPMMRSSPNSHWKYQTTETTETNSSGMRHDLNGSDKQPRNEVSSDSDGNNPTILSTKETSSSGDPRRRGESNVINENSAVQGVGRINDMEVYSAQSGFSTKSPNVPEHVNLENSTIVSGFEGTTLGDSTTSEEDGSQEDKKEDQSTGSEDPLLALQLKFLHGLASHNQTPPDIPLQSSTVPAAVTHTELSTTDDSVDKDKASVLFCGVIFCNRTNQLVTLIGILIIVLVVAVLFATGVIQSRPTTNPSRQPSSNPRSTSFPTPSVSSGPPATPSPTTLVPNTTIPPSLNPSSMNVPQWVQLGSDIDGDMPFDGLGFSIALSSDGRVLAVGAPFREGAGNSSGQVRCYEYSGNTWVQLGATLTGTAADGWFGYSLSLSADGMVLAVGVTQPLVVDVVGRSQVRVLRWNGTAWDAFGSSIDSEVPGDNFGSSVALSVNGTVLALGASLNDGRAIDAGQGIIGDFFSENRVVNTGHARVFVWNGVNWAQRGSNLDGESLGDYFGDSVALSSDGSIVACGADQTNVTGSGYVRVFRWSGTTWTQLGSTLRGSKDNDEFGESVSLSGNGTVLAIGADAGNYCIVYGYNGTDWSQVGQTINGVTSIDEFGFSVALSFDGDTVAIGGPSNNVNGFLSGQVRIFRLESDNVWVQLGQDLLGATPAGQLGRAVSISDDGSIIAVGGFGNLEGSNLGGRAQVFELRSDSS